MCWGNREHTVSEAKSGMFDNLLKCLNLLGGGENFLTMGKISTAAQTRAHVSHVRVRIHDARVMRLRVREISLRGRNRLNL